MFIGPNHAVIGLQPDADRYNADPASDVFNMEHYDHITFLLFEGAGGTGTVKLQVEECTAIDGTGATAIAFRYRVQSGETWGALTASAATGYTTTAGANKAVAVEVEAAELSDGSPFVRLQLTEVADDPCDAVLIAVLTKARYPQDVPATTLT